MSSDYRILIVDDDEMNIDILRDSLQEEYDVKAADSGEAALELIPQYNPHVILLDVVMSGIDGYEVCRRIRADDTYQSVKIILISGRAMEDERQKGFAVGADDYITKPFNVDDIADKIRWLKANGETSI